MKYCEDYAALLDLFVDGELPLDEMERVRAHLKSCPGCQAYVDDAMAIRAGFPDVEDTVVPEGFARDVMARVRGDGRKSARPVRHWVRTLAVLAACCALVILVRNSGFEERESVMMAGQAKTAFTAGSGADTDAGPEYGIAPEMETGDAPEAAVKVQTTAGDEAYYDDEMYGTRMASSAQAEAASESASADMAGGDVLYLTAGEAGELLDGAVLVWEGDGERHYELNPEEYQALLETLGRTAEMPKTDGAAFLVVVTEPGG